MKLKAWSTAAVVFASMGRRSILSPSAWLKSTMVSRPVADTVLWAVAFKTKVSASSILIRKVFGDLTNVAIVEFVAEKRAIDVLACHQRLCLLYGVHRPTT